MPLRRKKYSGGSINNTISGSQQYTINRTPLPFTIKKTTSPSAKKTARLYTAKKTTRPYTATKRKAIKTATKRKARKTVKKRQNNVRFDKCKHWFRISNLEKVDCLLKDKEKSDTPLKILIGSAQNTQRANYRKIVEDFLDDDSALGYFMTKSNKEKASLLGLFMVLQGGEYGVSYGLPSQKWLNVCVNAKMKK